MFNNTFGGNGEDASPTGKESSVRAAVFCSLICIAVIIIVIFASVYYAGGDTSGRLSGKYAAQAGKDYKVAFIFEKNGKFSRYEVRNGASEKAGSGVYTIDSGGNVTLQLEVGGHRYELHLVYRKADDTLLQKNTGYIYEKMPGV